MKRSEQMYEKWFSRPENSSDSNSNNKLYLLQKLLDSAAAAAAAAAAGGGGSIRADICSIKADTWAASPAVSLTKKKGKFPWDNWFRSLDPVFHTDIL